MGGAGGEGCKGESRSVPPRGWRGEAFHNICVTGTSVSGRRNGGGRTGRRRRSGGVQADLNGLVQEGTEAVGFRDRIAAPGFEQVMGQVAQGPMVVFHGGLALAIALEHPAEEVSDLEEEVKVLGGLGMLGVGVLHLEPRVFLLRPRKAVVGRAATARRPGGGAAYGRLAPPKRKPSFSMRPRWRPPSCERA